jgi:hypothetical protein
VNLALEEHLSRINIGVPYYTTYQVPAIGGRMTFKVHVASRDGTNTHKT